MISKKICILCGIVLISGIFLYACKNEKEAKEAKFSSGFEEGNPGKETESGREEAEQWEKGYGLPIEKQERKKAEADCNRVMESFFPVYEQAEKGNASNVVLSEDTVLKIQRKVGETGCPAYTKTPYSNMENEKEMERFLKACLDGKESSIVTYEIHSDGGIGRKKYIFDGTDLYVLSANAGWNAEKEPGISDISYTRIKEWHYSEKGWFSYELCVPEYPEVTEVMEGSCVIRVKPISEEQREISRKCIAGLGYQGNNLLRSNWDAAHLDKLDYNGIYEYLYGIKYGKKFEPEGSQNGIAKEEFESLLTEYLPVTAEQIREYAVFDAKKQRYAWVRLGCGNYTPNFFGASFSEITGSRKQEDGTVIFTIDAMCSTAEGVDAVITHELMVRFAGDGSFQYLGNRILNEGMEKIPDYQYRISGKNVLEDTR